MKKFFSLLLLYIFINGCQSTLSPKLKERPTGAAREALNVSCETSFPGPADLQLIANRQKDGEIVFADKPSDRLKEYVYTVFKECDAKKLSIYQIYQITNGNYTGLFIGIRTSIAAKQICCSCPDKNTGLVVSIPQPVASPSARITAPISPSPPAFGVWELVCLICTK